MNAPAFWIATGALLLAGWLVFRLLVRHEYRRRGRLGPLTAGLEMAVFCGWAAVGLATLPPGWPAPALPPPLLLAGWLMIATGGAMAAWSLRSLGMRRSLGREIVGLERSGLYGWSRNPQVLGCAVVALGYFLTAASAPSAAWALSYGVIAHWMILSEEEHLRGVYGEAYERYCRRVPRYLGIRRGK